MIRILTEVAAPVGARPSEMKQWILKAWVLGGCMAASTVLFAQQQPAPAQQKPAQQQPTPAGGNPFPEDDTSVPVMPNANSAAAPDTAATEAGSGLPAPSKDADPARSPDEEGANASSSSAFSTESSSSIPDMDKLMPKDDEGTHRKLGKQAPEFHETAANDIDVGKYALDRKEWKSALSRFQSAMVMDPENPEVYWGLAEASRHLGDFAGARNYYQKVLEYDPDSRHAKDAQKALKEPEIANAQSAKGPAQK
jgi:tetratricopeptide (TPR) repeat protein